LHDGNIETTTLQLERKIALDLVNEYFFPTTNHDEEPFGAVILTEYSFFIFITLITAPLRFG